MENGNKNEFHQTNHGTRDVTKNLDANKKDWRRTHRILREVKHSKKIKIKVINFWQQVLEAYPADRWVQAALDGVNELYKNEECNAARVGEHNEHAEEEGKKVKNLSK